MKMFFGITLILAGIAVGLYVGIWLMLIGGIVQVVQSASTDPINAMGIAIGIVRVLLTYVAGSLCAAFLLIPGVALLDDDF